MHYSTLRNSLKYGIIIPRGGVANVEYEIGQRVGSLVVLEKRVHHLGVSWLCRCDCGKETRLLSCRVKKSCGCMEKTLHGKSMEYQRLYYTWKHMIYRCTKPSETGYERYGGKGVTICDEWKDSFIVFLDWALSNGYSDELTIDRMDSLKPYEPSNCRWATIFVQAVNKRVNKNNKLGHKGVSPLGDKFRVHLMRHGIRKHLGTFDTIGEAITMREYALNQYELTGTF